MGGNEASRQWRILCCISRGGKGLPSFYRESKKELFHLHRRTVLLTSLLLDYMPAQPQNMLPADIFHPLRLIASLFGAVRCFRLGAKTKAFEFVVWETQGKPVVLCRALFCNFAFRLRRSVRFSSNCWGLFLTLSLIVKLHFLCRRRK